MSELTMIVNASPLVFRRGRSPLSAAALGYDKPLCASLDGFTLHAATAAP